MTVTSAISPNLFVNEKLTEDDLRHSRFCLAGMKVLTFTRDEGGIPLTKSGAFYRKFVIWAVDEFRWPGYTVEELAVVNKVLNEDDVLPLSMLHAVLRSARLLRHAKGKALLTPAGKKIVGDHGQLQATLFETFFTRFDFTAYERWVIEFEDADTFHFIGVIRNRLTDWVAYPDFAGWCLPIYALPSARGSPEQDAMFYLFTRLIRPLLWLGLIEQQQAPRLAPLQSLRFRKTPLFDTFLRFEMDLGSVKTLH